MKDKSMAKMPFPAKGKKKDTPMKPMKAEGMPDFMDRAKRPGGMKKGGMVKGKY